MQGLLFALFGLYPLARRRAKRFLLFGFLAFLGCIALCIACSNRPAPSTGSVVVPTAGATSDAATAKPEPQAAPPLLVAPKEKSAERAATPLKSQMELYNYYGDVITADPLFLGKIVTVPLAKYSFGRSWKDELTGHYLVGLDTFDGQPDNMGVICELSKEGVAEYQKNSKTIADGTWLIEGVCRGRRATGRVFTGYEVVLTDCQFVASKSK